MFYFRGPLEALVIDSSNVLLLLSSLSLLVCSLGPSLISSNFKLVKTMTKRPAPAETDEVQPTKRSRLFIYPIEYIGRTECMFKNCKTCLEMKYDDVDNQALTKKG